MAEELGLEFQAGLPDSQSLVLSPQTQGSQSRQVWASILYRGALVTPALHLVPPPVVTLGLSLKALSTSGQ